ncbi:MAG TPA: hypothetical protein VHG51_05980 [Longimicrobiaceae bacterium]|nr:hypothetical protein [Longimicrobiaceae bacterium]
MILLLAAALAAAHPALPADTVVAPRADAYLDAGARETVRLARERRTGVESALRRYRAVSRSRISLGLRMLRRDRLFFRCESAVRVDWRRGEPTIREVLGGREVVPLVERSVEPDGDCGSSVHDPSADRLTLGLGGFLGGEDAFARHPLAPGSEADYRFRSGDTVTVRIPGVDPLRLVELRVIPRRNESSLVSGSLWLESGSHAVVRAVLRLARPFDLETDGPRLDPDDDDLQDIPGVMKPIRADIRYVTVEYGLWHQRFWLPRLVAMEGEAQVGKLARFPLRMEQTYGEYEVEGDPPGTPPAPTTALAPASPDPGAGSGRRCTSTSVRGGVLRDSLAAAHPDFEVGLECECSNGRCRETVTLMPRDTQRVVASPHLPPSIFEEGEALVSRAEMDELISLAKQASPAPWQLGGPRLTWAGRAPDLLRYNRVEGLSVGARADWELGRATADATLRLGTADLEPDVVLGATRVGPVSRHRLAAYRRLNAVDGAPRALGLGNSLSALLLGDDEGFYYRTLGAELLRSPVAGRGLGWRLFAERQTAADKSTDWSLGDLWGDAGFRGNIAAAEADQAGAALTWRAARGSDPAGWRGGMDLSLEGSAGTFAFARPSAAVFAGVPLPGGLVGSAEAAAGTSAGDVPVQSHWYLGGPGTVRGYHLGERAGEAFWRARAEVGRAAPGARIVVFSDAGWAGPRGSWELDPPLLSAGVGASFLDGLVRLDLARALREPAGWGVSLYLDALM